MYVHKQTLIFSLNLVKKSQSNFHLQDFLKTNKNQFPPSFVRTKTLILENLFLKIVNFDLFEIVGLKLLCGPP